MIERRNKMKEFKAFEIEANMGKQTIKTFNPIPAIVKDILDKGYEVVLCSLDRHYMATRKTIDTNGEHLENAILFKMHIAEETFIILSDIPYYVLKHYLDNHSSVITGYKETIMSMHLDFKYNKDEKLANYPYYKNHSSVNDDFYIVLSSLPSNYDATNIKEFKIDICYYDDDSYITTTL